MTELDRILGSIWQLLSSPPREAVLATVADRRAEARMVILRGLDRERGAVWFHSDSLTPKLVQIARHPGGTLLLRDVALGQQIRLRVWLSAGPGDGAEFAALDPASQGNYGTLPPPGTPIRAADGYERRADPARFTQVDAQIETVDFVDLGASPHRRAGWERAAGPDIGWTGRWLAP